jgi:isopenicillin-N N-acyltransferase-like protein|tara:strand:- start:3 stop:1115 length:1113 start_codon:yes stop_codon:yes gene_type:complete
MINTNNVSDRLHRLELRGSSRERGRQHGRLLAKPIGVAIDFYHQLFRHHLDIDIPEIRRRAGRYVDPLAKSCPAVLEEMEGIAEGARQELYDILTLTVRYEITFEHLQLGECSNIFVGPQRTNNGHTLLGMNWEWRPEVMAFRAVIMAHCDDQPDHLVVTECGQPGKYGLNEYGIVAIETGLGCSSNRSIGRIPFAALIRQALMSTSLEGARAVIRDNPPEATINFFIADDLGRGWCLEATPKGVFERALQREDVYWHTNHCRLVDEACAMEDSLIRGERWQRLVSFPDPIDRKQVGQWLADTENGDNAICKVLNPELSDKATWLETLTSIVLDADAREIWVSDGPSAQQPYERFCLFEPFEDNQQETTP